MANTYNDGAGLGSAMQMRQAQASAYNQASGGQEATAVAQTGLVRIADEVIQAASRIDQIAIMLGQLALGVHGPRPEPVSDHSGQIKGAGSDSLAARVQQLSEAVDRLQRAYESVVR